MLESKVTNDRTHHTESPQQGRNAMDATERISLYRPGGCHPVELGDKVHNRYVVEHKIGYGGYSTVWLARDLQYEHKRLIALKIIVAAARAMVTRVRRPHFFAAWTHNPTGYDYITDKEFTLCNCELLCIRVAMAMEYIFIGMGIF